MAPLNTIWQYSFKVNNIPKSIRIQIGDICNTDEEFDVLVCSAFKNDYIPTPRSLIGALLFQKQISVQKLAANPSIDLKNYGCWLSEEIEENFHRIACVELIDNNSKEDWLDETKMLRSAFSTFRFLLEQASIQEIPLKSVALPILGTGDQCIEEYYIVPPLVEQCLSALNTISELSTITFFARHEQNVITIIKHLNNILFSKKQCAPEVFISYSSKQTDIAQNVYNYLLDNSISCWMAPNSIPTGSSYQEEIPIAINQIASLVLLLTPDAEKSRWVQKEVGTAIGADKKIFPYQLTEFELNVNFKFLLEGEQIYPAWENDMQTWLEKLLTKVKGTR